MSPTDLERFAALLPAIKADWQNRLRSEPSLSTLGRSGTVEFLMDATLMQLAAGLARRSNDRGLAQPMPVALMAHRYCACAMEPIKRYYSTGEDALRSVLDPAFGAPLEMIFKNFRATFDSEIAAMCAECLHPDWQGCGLRKIPSPEKEIQT